MKALLIIILFCLAKSASSPSILKKYSTVETFDEYVIFEAKDFKEDEEMHFKITTYKYGFEFDFIYYYYIDDDFELDAYKNYAKPKNFDSKVTYDWDDSHSHEYETRYFTIKKKSSEFHGAQGNYMVIEFYLDDHPSYHYNNWAEVSNTEEDEGKLETWVIVVIVVIVVAIIAGIIIYCICRRIRLAKAAQVNQARTAAVAVAANEMAAQQNAAYMAQQNAEYIAQQNYQAQQNAAYMAQQNYQGQPYQDPNYLAADAGYSSNAAVVAV